MPSRRPIRPHGSLAVARFPLAALALAAALLLPAGSARAVTVEDYCADPEEQLFLDLINNYRAQNGLAPVWMTQSLGATAEQHSIDMAGNGYFSHTRLDGSSVGDSLQANGYVDGTYGENIAAGVESASEAFAMWQASPSHNANMLEDNFNAIGIGRSYQAGSGYGWYWTTVFGGEPDAPAMLCGGGLAAAPAQPEIAPEIGRPAPELDPSANATTTDLLNLRSGPGPDNAILAEVPNRARLQVIGTQQDGYVPVQYNGQAGWVLAEEVVVDGSPAAEAPEFETTETRDAATATLAPETTTTTLAETTSVEQPAPAQESSAALFATDDLNLRAGPSPTDPILTVIPAGSPLTPNGNAASGYLGVEFAGTPGWVDAAYVTGGTSPAPAPAETVQSAQTAPAPPTEPAAETTAASPVTTATALDAVNFRAGPSYDDAVVDLIPAGTSVSLTGESSGGFLGVSYGGVVGWVDAAYLA